MPVRSPTSKGKRQGRGRTKGSNVHLKWQSPAHSHCNKCFLYKQAVPVGLSITSDDYIFPYRCRGLFVVIISNWISRYKKVTRLKNEVFNAGKIAGAEARL